MQLQNLLNMKIKLNNIDSQFNFLLTQIQNIGIIPNTNIQLSNISLQFINFGIEMLNKGLQMSNMMDNYNIKGQIDNIINQLNNISISISNNSINNLNPFQNNKQIINNNHQIPKYNVFFYDLSNNRKVMIFDNDITLEEMIMKYSLEIGWKNLNYDTIDESIHFIFNGRDLNTEPNRYKKLKEIFLNNDNFNIYLSKKFSPKFLNQK